MSSSSNNAPSTLPNSQGMPSAADNNNYNGMKYVFTINNPNDHARSLVHASIGKEISKSLGDGFHLTYAIWSLERGSQGTQHIQGYFEINKKKKWNALKNHLKPFHAWCAPARGSAQSNIDYISHTGEHEDKAGALCAGPWYLGDEPSKGQGNRTDIKALADALKEGKSMVSLATDHTDTMLKYFSNAQKLHTLLNKKTRQWMTELYIYTGVAGSGKSHAAYEEAKQYLKDNNLEEEPYMLMIPSNPSAPLWWQDYDGQSVVIIDDFYGTIGLNYFKQLVDKYPMKVNMKNGHAEFLAKRIYVTSNQGWRTWWSTELLQNKENEHAIVRRITVDKHFADRYNPASKNVVGDDDDVVLATPIRSNANVGLNFVPNHNDVFDVEPENVEQRLLGRDFFRQPSAPIEPAALPQHELDFLNEEFGEAWNELREEYGAHEYN